MAEASITGAFPFIARNLFGDDGVVGRPPRERTKTFLVQYVMRAAAHQWHTYSVKVSREVIKIDQARVVVDAQWDGTYSTTVIMDPTDGLSAVCQGGDLRVLKTYVTEARKLIKLLSNYEEPELMAKLEKYKSLAEDMRKQLAEPELEVKCE